ncbi:hypothetical protein [Crocosphaera sp.]|uniref:hypothetical protein n=1 Tax=Crocosphaera sp. TaxID=2729996 RepID=UPI00260E9D50|nr:hypothetical protein [Crocosphaera sp.]MDJ0579205.1 hypothetical protein [Crocosphaera sp.]
MSVIVIGDRLVGKTNMVVALAEGTENLVITEPDPQSIIMKKSNITTGMIAGTSKVEEETLSISVNLSTGWREFQTNWIDTPGEAWSNPIWRQDNPAQWQDIKNSVRDSKAVFLLMPPSRNMINPDQLDGGLGNELDQQPTSLQWQNQLGEKLSFLRKNAPNVQHILISIHKADLFCNITQKERKWRYNPLQNFRWVDYNEHIQQAHFKIGEKIIRQHNRQAFVTPRFFIIAVAKAIRTFFCSLFPVPCSLKI